MTVWMTDVTALSSKIILINYTVITVWFVCWDRCMPSRNIKQTLTLQHQPNVLPCHWCRLVCEWWGGGGGLQHSSSLVLCDPSSQRTWWSELSLNSNLQVLCGATSNPFEVLDMCCCTVSLHCRWYSAVSLTALRSGQERENNIWKTYLNI